jgi:hypothetical protein
MIKIIAINKNLTVKAGQMLVVHDSGVVHVVDREQVNQALGFASKPVQDAAPNEPTNRQAMIARLLLARCSVKKICTATGATRDEVMIQRGKMTELGLVNADSNHHWFKSPEKLEAAKMRALHMYHVKMARKQGAARE